MNPSKGFMRQFLRIQQKKRKLEENVLLLSLVVFFFGCLSHPSLLLAQSSSRDAPDNSYCNKESNQGFCSVKKLLEQQFEEERKKSTPISTQPKAPPLPKLCSKKDGFKIPQILIKSATRKEHVFDTKLRVSGIIRGQCIKEVWLYQSQGDSRQIPFPTVDVIKEYPLKFTISVNNQAELRLTDTLLRETKVSLEDLDTSLDTTQSTKGSWHDQGTW
jgi:hypothetical protein